MSTNPGTSGVGGYTCPRCGAFVLNGVTHNCAMNAYPRPDRAFQLIQAIYALRDEVKRVADALVSANEETAGA